MCDNVSRVWGCGSRIEIVVIMTARGMMVGNAVWGQGQDRRNGRGASSVR